MDLDLTEDQRILKDSVTRFAQDLNAGAKERDRDGEFSRELWLRCGEQGLQGLPVPQELGGSGLDPLSCSVALEAFGYGCRDGGLSFSICAHLLACVIPIWKHGSKAQHERYLSGLCSGKIIAANAMTEPGTGSDAFAMTTRAVPDGDGFRLTEAMHLVQHMPAEKQCGRISGLDRLETCGGLLRHGVEASVVRQAGF